MTKKLIVLGMFLVLAFSFAPVYKAEAISEEGIRDICRQEIAKDRELEAPVSSVEGRVANLENEVSGIKRILEGVNSFLLQVVDMLVKLIK